MHTDGIVAKMVHWLWRLRIKGTLSSLAVRQRYEPSFEINPKGQAS
jgi:hypothetical protein